MIKNQICVWCGAVITDEEEPDCPDWDRPHELTCEKCANIGMLCVYKTEYLTQLRKIINHLRTGEKHMSRAQEKLTKALEITVNGYRQDAPGHDCGKRAMNLLREIHNSEFNRIMNRGCLGLSISVSGDPDNSCITAEVIEESIRVNAMLQELTGVPPEIDMSGINSHVIQFVSPVTLRALNNDSLVTHNRGHHELEYLGYEIWLKSDFSGYAGDVFDV